MTLISWCLEELKTHLSPMGERHLKDRKVGMQGKHREGALKKPRGSSASCVESHPFPNETWVPLSNRGHLPLVSAASSEKHLGPERQRTQVSDKIALKGYSWENGHVFTLQIEDENNEDVFLQNYS